MLIVSPVGWAVAVESSSSLDGGRAILLHDRVPKPKERKSLRLDYSEIEERHRLCSSLKHYFMALSAGFHVMSDDPRFSVVIEGPCGSLLEAEVVEIPLLLPGWEASILETVAHQRGLTAGAMVRHLLHDFLVDAPARRGQPS
jgi:hypothetical protein